MIGGVTAAAVDTLGVVVEGSGRVDENKYRRVATVRCREVVDGGTAPPARIQSAGVLNGAPIIITVGNRGGGLVANQAGGRYTNSSRWRNFDESALMVTRTTTPRRAGRHRAASM